MSFFKDLSKRLTIKIPGDKKGKYGKFLKIGGALAMGPVLGPVNPLSMDKDVLGARGSVSSPGMSFDSAKEAKLEAVGEATAVAARESDRAKEAQAQADAKREQDSQLSERRRRKRFAYGYDRASNADALGGSGGGTSDAPKTLLGY